MPTRSLRGLAAMLAIAAGLLAPGAAVAQADPPISALRNHDTDAPIDIDAERIEVRDADAQAIFSGGVRVRQGKMELGADQLRVFYERSDGDALTILRIDAEGNVSLASPSERARARYGIYDVEERQLTMVGDVVLNRGDSELRGQRLSINLESGRSTLDGATGATEEAPAAVAQGGRVTGRFVVPDRSRRAQD